MKPKQTNRGFWMRLKWNGGGGAIIIDVYRKVSLRKLLLVMVD